jgi:cell division septal protein FtsQ
MAARDSKVPIRRPKEIASTRKTFLLAIFVIAQCIFLNSAMFRVQTIEVTGNSRLHDDVIKAQAALPLQGHLFCVPLHALEDRVRNLHWVEGVAVRRYMPGRIQIRVKERTAVLAVGRVGEARAFPHHWFVVSEDGVILAPAGAPGDEKLPRVLTGAAPMVGRKMPSGVVARVRQTLAAIPRSLAGSVKDLEADEEGQLSLTLTLLGRPVEVRLGGSERAEYKFEVLQALAARLQEEGKPVTYIDLRFTDPAVGHLVSVARTGPPSEPQQ